MKALQRENTERLEALERENERMRSENAELRHKVDTLEGSGTTRRGEVPVLRARAGPGKRPRPTGRRAGGCCSARRGPPPWPPWRQELY